MVNYAIEVDASYTDDGFAASGDIYVKNPAPMDATITGVEDALPGATNLTVECGVDFPYELPAGETLMCSYSADLPDGSSRTNTATATLQNYAYDHAGNAAATGTTSFQGTAEVTFGDPARVFDECIDLSDSMQGNLGTVCASDAPQTFQYSIYVGPYDICGTYTVENTADFLTGDSGTSGEDSWTVTVNVPCVDGCTLTQGYWKTHSEFGPAPYDDTWALLPNGADTPFFLSGQSYYEVLWTAPKGNAYYILAHQYIAAELNVLNGASIPSEALDAWNEAAALFNTYTPEEVAEMKGKNGNGLRAQFVALAEILDAYNNGLIGPGHCSE
jgi:hypothetical protein